jgi:hypothetical protein
MLSKSAGIAALTVSGGLLLATVAQAKTIKWHGYKQGHGCEHRWVVQLTVTASSWGHLQQRVR